MGANKDDIISEKVLVVVVTGEVVDEMIAITDTNGDSRWSIS